MTAPILVLGQAGGGDDAIGLRVGQALRDRGHRVQEAGPEDLIEALAQAPRLILVDAVRGDRPGAVHHLREEALAAAPRAVSSHALSVPEALGLARVLHPQAGAVDIVGVEIGPPTPFASPSAEVLAAIPAAVALVEVLLQEPCHA